MTAKSSERRPNQLIHEKGPYLLQHAYNPVDWFPWGDEAFEKARREDKPIFLSIGYSTCHWCHVMEKESFEDEEVARLMNDAFVCIKVDREERPDLDGLYQRVCQMLTGSGGWPLNLIMTPDKKPFYAATYIPKESRFGLVGVLELIPRVQAVWRTEREEVEKTWTNVETSLNIIEKSFVAGEIRKEVLDIAFRRFSADFDEQNGGFGSAPKFPSPQNLLFLLRYWKRTGDKTALRMVEKTLTAMRGGGIFDHVGFGFHRYSTDARWLAPHFEKMLYDQALLALAYTEAFQATGNEGYERTARGVLDYVLRELPADEGGFCSGQDADSEGEEGKFYVWSQKEIQEALSAEDADVAIRIFEITEEGNFADLVGGKVSRKNILHFTKPLDEAASKRGLSVGELSDRLEKIRKSLFVFREKRVRPVKDDKVLVDWNGLTVAALTRASQVLGDGKYLEAAIRTVDFVLEKMRSEEGRLSHRYAKGESAIDAFLDDYVFLVWGLIELYEASFEARYLKYALELTEVTLAKFWDQTSGGFYQTASDAEEVLMRRKEVFDGAVPSGNSVAMLNLLRLARLTGDTRYEEYAAKTGRAFAGSVRTSPEAYAFMLCAVDYAVGPTYEVVLVGNLQSDDTSRMVEALRKRYLPTTIVLFRSIDKPSAELLTVSKFVGVYEAVEGRATAYVCRNQVCMPPTNEVAKLLSLLEVDV